MSMTTFWAETKNIFRNLYKEETNYRKLILKQESLFLSSNILDFNVGKDLYVLNPNRKLNDIYVFSYFWL